MLYSYFNYASNYNTKNPIYILYMQSMGITHAFSLRWDIKGNIFRAPCNSNKLFPKERGNHIFLYKSSSFNEQFLPVNQLKENLTIFNSACDCPGKKLECKKHTASWPEDSFEVIQKLTQSTFHVGIPRKDVWELCWDGWLGSSCLPKGILSVEDLKQ